MFAAYQLAERVMVLRHPIALLAADAATTWIHIAMCGEWKGHHSGPFTLTLRDFERIVSNFNAERNPIPLDWEHASEWADEAPAAGWIHKLAIRGNHLWGWTEFGSRAAKQVKAKEYIFSSGVFDFSATDRETAKEIGCRLRSVALTNQPFLDGQEPIQLTIRGPHMLSAAAPKEALIAALQDLDGDTLDPQQVLAVAEGLAKLESAKEAPEEETAEMADPPVPPEEEEEEEVEASMQSPDPALAKPVDAADGPGMADGETALAAVAPLMEAWETDVAGVAAVISERLDAIVAAGRDALAEPEAEAMPMSQDGPPAEPDAEAIAATVTVATVRDLSARVKVLMAEKAARDKSDAEVEVDKLIEAGRILDSGRADMVALCLSSRPRFDGIVAALGQAVPTGRLPAADGKPATADAAIDESDPMVVSLRRLSVGSDKATQDRAIRAAMANKGNGAAH